MQTNNAETNRSTYISRLILELQNSLGFENGVPTYRNKVYMDYGYVFPKDLDILFIQAEGNYSIYHCYGIEFQKLISSKSIGVIETCINPVKRRKLYFLFPEFLECN